MKLSEEKLSRYSRQMVLSGVGGLGQKKLSEAKVLVCGAGGLGSLVLYYLAAAGVGKIGIVDYDRVALSNLHRQIIHFTEDVNKEKVFSAKEKILKLNPYVKVLCFQEKLTKENIEKTIKDFDIVVDGLDNFNDKFLLNDCCVKLCKKLVHAGVIGFEGQILTVIPGESACLRCYFSEVPKDLRQNCKEVGILGPTVGVLSTLQASEVLKLILEIGKPLINRVLKYDALNEKFYEFKFNGDRKHCCVCAQGLSSQYYL